MDRRQQAGMRQPHTAEVQEVYDHVLSGAAVQSRHIDVGTDRRVHLLEKGEGPTLVLLHAAGTAAGLFLPLLHEFERVRALAPDRPGQGLSDPIDLPRQRYREAVVAWVDRLLDELGLDDTALLGNSGGAVWALWYALSRPDRVRRLVLIGSPALPGTRPPLPVRLMATPGVGDLLSRASSPSPESMVRFARFIGEAETLPAYPDLLDLLVAVARDPVADRAGRAEVRALTSPFALLSPSGWRRRSRVRRDDLRRLSVPTQVVWGERETLGSVATAQALADLIPQGRLQVLAGGHAPWLAEPARAAAAIGGFVRDQVSA
ncbi:MAG: alpha/beta fold hydrolase [Actinomycetota bacterium]